MDASWIYAYLSLFLLVIALMFNFSNRGKNQKLLPPSPVPSLPFIGHLHLLKSPMHRTYHELSKKLGPIFSLRLGNRLVVVVSSPSAVAECFTKNDIVLANRPRFILGKYVGYNYTDITTSPYGEHWRNLRRIMAVEIFSTTRLNMFESIRQDEIRLLLQKLYQSLRHDFDKVELKPFLSEMSFNIILRMMTGKRYIGEHEDKNDAMKLRELIIEVIKCGGVANPADFFPVLRWIDYKGLEKNLAKLSKKLDEFMQCLIDEHRRNKQTNTMIAHLLSLQESQPEYYTDPIIKGIIIAMLLGAADTSSITIEWAISSLLNNPEKLEKARAEVDSFVGNDRLLKESEASNLPYLQNIISETFRLLPATPLLVPHESSDDCRIGGYDIPRGTILLVNTWALHRDPIIWDDPTSFRPERFEGKEVGPTKFMPFGMGRRSCPGNVLAQKLVGLTLGSLIHSFEWQRINEDKVDMTEGEGLAMPKAVPLEARCKARDVLHNVFSRAA